MHKPAVLAKEVRVSNEDGFADVFINSLNSALKSWKKGYESWMTPLRE